MGGMRSLFCLMSLVLLSLITPACASSGPLQKEIVVKAAIAAPLQALTNSFMWLDSRMTAQYKAEADLARAKIVAESSGIVEAETRFKQWHNSSGWQQTIDQMVLAQEAIDALVRLVREGKPLKDRTLIQRIIDGSRLALKVLSAAGVGIPVAIENGVEQGALLLESAA